MILRLLVLACLMAASTPLLAAGDEEQLRGLLDDFMAGASRNDAAAHDRFWSDDLVYTSSRGERFGKGAIMEGISNAPEVEGEPQVVYSAEDVQVMLFGDAAVVAFRLLGSSGDESMDTLEYFNTGTFVKRDGEWRAVAWQATQIPERE